MEEENKVGTLTLADRLSTNNNALNFVRLVLATLVIFGHAFPLGDFKPVVIGSFALGAWHGTAVECFFCCFWIPYSCFRYENESKTIFVETLP